GGHIGQHLLRLGANGHITSEIASLNLGQYTPASLSEKPLYGRVKPVGIEQSSQIPNVSDLGCAPPQLPGRDHARLAPDPTCQLTLRPTTALPFLSDRLAELLWCHVVTSFPSGWTN